MDITDINVTFAQPEHAKYAEHIVNLIYESALQRGTGIARRTPEYIAAKINGGKSVVALHGDRLVGFSYIESWSHGDFVATSGLIVDPEYRHLGLAGAIKAKTFELARLRFPFAKLFSITTRLPVMKLNSRMGYKPVTFSELTDERSSGEDVKDAATTTSCSATTGACVSAPACSMIPSSPLNQRSSPTPTCSICATRSRSCFISDDSPTVSRGDQASEPPIVGGLIYHPLLLFQNH